MIIDGGRYLARSKSVFSLSSGSWWVRKFLKLVFCLFFLPKMIFGKTEIQNPRHSNKLFTEKEEGSDSPPFQQGK